MLRKIAVVTGSRAEYGLLRPVLQAINKSTVLELQLIATGTHLSPSFDLTYQEIEADGFPIDEKVEITLDSDTPTGITQSIGLGLTLFGKVLERLEPDIVLILGDRFEMLPAAISAMIARIPIAHLHGGESTTGAIDDAIRHAITKMSHLHFVATPTYADRVIQMGENPQHVFVVGGLGVDVIRSATLLDRDSLEKSLDIVFSDTNFLITYHPVTLEPGHAVHHISELLTALRQYPDTGLFFTMPNADAEGHLIRSLLSDFVKSNPKSRLFTSLGTTHYLSMMKHVDLMVGNSSSGLLEMPTFTNPTINIGNRQSGRLSASSVINCGTEHKDIIDAITIGLSPSFRLAIKDIDNPYGLGGASEKIAATLASVSLTALLNKSFCDMQQSIP